MSLWPYFSTVPTFENPLKNYTSYFFKVGYWEVGFLIGFSKVGFVENYGLRKPYKFLVPAIFLYFPLIRFYKPKSFLTSLKIPFRAMISQGNSLINQVGLYKVMASTLRKIWKQLPT